jgi:protein-tyrosine phosphatase
VRTRLALAAILLLLACGGAPPPDQRIVPSSLPAAQREAHRRLPVEGAHNLRDLGGYATADGRRVKWGVLYRSDALADLSDDDLAYLERLQLRHLVDFRSDLEVERDPDRVPDSPELRVVRRPIQGDALDPTEIRELILSGEAEPRDMEALLLAANRAFVTDFGDVYAGFLHDLAEPGKLPTLFHCTAGKDRAGFAAALALSALGVPRETIMRDYLRTNEFTADHTERMLTVLRIVSFFRTDPDSVRPLFEARRSYLEAAFDTIDEKFGGTGAYLRQGLGADDALLARIRANLLE